MPQSIDWRHDGLRLFVPVIIYPPRPLPMEGMAGRALIDTGSTTTGIVRNFAQTLGLPQRGKRPMGGVGGELQVQRYLFRVGMDGDTDPEEVPRFPIVFDDVEGFELRDAFAFDVLLGMDILRQCDLELTRGGRARLCFG